MPRDTADRVASVCPHDCPSTCALDIEMVDAKTIGRVHGSADNDYTSGVVCAKVARYAERQHHPDRLTQPLQRVGEKGSGKFRPISWDDALDEVAGAMDRARQRHGGEAVWPYHFAGTMGLVMRDGIERLRNVFGFSRQNSTICTTLASTGWKAGVGKRRGTDSREIAHSDMIIVWGTNPVATQVQVMTHISRARKERGAKLYVIDPHRNGSAQAADVHLMLRPGTDGALACAVMHVLFRDGYADRDFMARHADDPAGFEAHLKSRTPEWAAGITGLTVQQIEDFARAYGQAERSFIRVGYGFSRSRNGSINLHAVSCLPTVRGMWNRFGGGALYGQTEIYGLDQTMVKGLDRLDTSKRALDMSRIGPVLLNDPEDIGDGPPVDVLFIQNTNPMDVAPEQKKVHEGFAREDLFVCTHEQFMTATARMSDIVLPATTFLEHDDLYIASGHTYLQIARKLLEPLGECRNNNDVLNGIGQRLGTDYPAFYMSEAELIEETLRASGKPDMATLTELRWIDCQVDEAERRFENGFEHADGKFHFRPNWAEWGSKSEGLPEFPDHWDGIEVATEQHPFRMFTPPARQFLNSSFTETPTSRKQEGGSPEIHIHPDDCTELGVDTGDVVRVGNDRASILIRVKAFDGVQRGVVAVPSIWPSSDYIEGLGANALVGADAAPPAGGAAFHDAAVWIRTEPA
jgi:anaerobic selenocysteine-containing dehydrogenase